MDQISLPMRIALAASLVFAALWFVALRPKPVDPDSEPLPVTPAKTKQATPTKQPESTPARKTEAKPAAERPKPAAGKTATAPKTASGAVLADVKAGRTVVLLFWAMNSADDRAVQREVAQVDRRGGKVAVHFARMSNLPKYEAITKANPVTTSPTVLVIDKQAKARAIAGLTTTREIDAVVSRALKVR